ncbi:MAG: AraC-like DNA-binding protein [Spirosomataceae bacterium]|jgi:AraC-like DNA-binding protein
MMELYQSSGLSRVIKLLALLNQLSRIEKPTLLASVGFTHSYDEVDSARLNSTYQYILQNFQSHIDLNKIADIASINANSFYRYFKSKTNKTFSSFLLEIRVGHACKLLLNTDMKISEVCYGSEFNNLSNFNRYFKLIIDKTPSEYRNFNCWC